MTISTIDPSTPDDGDPVGDGDNQIRALKQAIVSQFVGQTGDLWDTPLTVGPRALNAINQLASASELTALEARVSSAELAIVAQAGIFTTLGGRVTALENAGYTTLNNAKAGAWPVGSIFISADGGTPASKGLPGTWTRVGDGRFLLGSAPAGAGDTGGSNSVTLTKANIPAHQHKHVTVGDENANPAPAPAYSGFNKPRHQGGSGVRWNENTTENGTADGLKTSPTPVNITPAYLKVSFYQRTA